MKRLNSRDISRLEAEKYLYIRAGDTHRFVVIWGVVIGRRLFVRPWNGKPTGWYHAFLEDPKGAIKVGNRVVRVTARRVRGPKLIDAVDEAYGAKYSTSANRKWVRGFATKKRKATTTELIPA